MKVGDLVKTVEAHGLHNESYRAIGIVLKLNPAHSGLSASVTVAWNDGDIEVEWPDYLETVNESR